jgi:hypothetical protein
MACSRWADLCECSECACWACFLLSGDVRFTPDYTPSGLLWMLFCFVASVCRREDKYDLKDEELRPYCALPAVLDGLFKVGRWRCVLVRLAVGCLVLSA